MGVVVVDKEKQNPGLTPITSGLGYNLGTTEGTIEFIERMFGTHCIVPAQLYNTRQVCGENKLLFALLEDALRIICCHYSAESGRKRREAREAWSWIFAEDDSICSARTVCDLYGIDINRLRGAIRRLVNNEANIKVARRAPVNVANPIHAAHKRNRGRRRLGNALQRVA